MKLTNHIAHNIHLKSTSCNGLYLSVDEEGDLSLKEKDSGYDQLWSLLPEATDPPMYHIVSSRYSYALKYNSHDTGEVGTTKNGDEATMWAISSKGEIYQPFKSGKRYLWVTDDNVYTTPDDYISESWEYDLPVEERQYGSSISGLQTGLIIALVIVIVFVLITNLKK